MSIFNSSGSHIQKDDCLNYYENYYIEQFKIYTQAIKIQILGNSVNVL